KDLEQAAALIQWFSANDPRSLQEAWNDAGSRGPGWRKRLLEGWKAVQQRWPSLPANALSENPD
ncbi:hypothetical protein ABTH38_20065, partial [Acinetobacter baumannii]